MRKIRITLAFALIVIIIQGLSLMIAYPVLVQITFKPAIPDFTVKYVEVFQCFISLKLKMLKEKIKATYANIVVF